MRNGDCAASVRLHVEMGCGHAEHEESQLPSIHVGQGEGVSEARGPGPPRQGVTRTSSATGPGLDSVSAHVRGGSMLKLLGD